MSRILAEDLQEIAVEAGALVLENGGETYRSEKTVVRVAKALGAKAAYSFVTPTVVIFSWYNDCNQHFVNMKRILRRGTNLKKIAMVNTLARELEWSGRTEEPQHLRDELRQIRESSSYPSWFVVAMAGLSSCMFTKMFGGSYVDGLYALVYGVLLRLLVMFLERVSMNGFIVTLVSGAFVSVLAEFSLIALPFTVHKDVAMIGTLMQVVPGLALVNAIRDLIAGDLMAGAARLLEALMIAAGLSTGAVTGMLLMRLF